MVKYDNEKLYIIIDEEYRDTFEDKVNEFLSRGYLPLGGVSVHTDKDDRVHFCQALLKSDVDIKSRLKSPY